MSNKLKLSELEDNVEVTYEYSHNTWTVGDLKAEITKFNVPHHEQKGWCIACPEAWHPDADSMIENWIDSEADNLYEDADETLRDQLTKDHIQRIQDILNEAYGVDGVQYWTHGKDVEIDIFPSNEVSHEKQ